MRSLCLGLFILLFILGRAQNIHLTGYILDKETKEPSFFVSIYDTINKSGTISDENGYFSLILPKGNSFLTISFARHVYYSRNITLKKDTTINFFISSVQLDEVTIIANEELLHKQTISGKIYIPIQKINSIPSISGQVDLFKSISYLPGVTNGREGKSNLIIRGGSKDQNLILMDGAIVYNPYHPGGFITSINPDIVKAIEFYKDGFPARYGGRSSSVLDITLNEGNKYSWHGKINLGLISTGFSIEGPIKKEKTSMILAFRSSYFHLLNLSSRKAYKEAEKLPLELNSSIYEEVNNFSFYTINIKISHIINNKNKLNWHIHTSNDSQIEGEIYSEYREASKRKSVYKIRTYSTSIDYHYYKNSTTSLIANINFHNLSGKLNENEDYISLENHYKSDYQINNYLNELGIKSEIFKRYLKQNFRFGGEYNLLTYQPGNTHNYFVDYNSNIENDTTYYFNGDNTISIFSLFLENEINFSQKSNINLGIRIPLLIANNKINAHFEPRISYRYLFSDNISFKSSYTLMHQYLHAVTSNYLGLEKESWIGSTSKVPPSFAHQLNLGVFGYLRNANIEIGIEGFYKILGDLIYNNSSFQIILTSSNTNSK